MKATVVTPLFPPDIAAPAPYCKELVQRLSSTHTTRVLLYGKLPEQVPGVFFTSVPKNLRILSRLLKFTCALHKEAKQSDLLFIQNGSSVELPTILVSLFTRTPIVFYLSDVRATKKNASRLLLRTIEKLASLISTKTISTSEIPLPLPRPEIMPFTGKDESLFVEYENSWQTHLRQLEKVFAHVSH